MCPTRRVALSNPTEENPWQLQVVETALVSGKRIILATPGSGPADAYAVVGNELMTKLLLIEDDSETAEEIKAELADRGFEVEWSPNGLEGLNKARSLRPDAMIVDRLLPGMDGLAVIEALRKDQMRTPVLVLSELGAVDDRVRGLRMGGNDYLTKPFALVELVARIEALLRRPAKSRETTLRVGALELDLIERTARRGDRMIDLLPREFRAIRDLSMFHGFEPEGVFDVEDEVTYLTAEEVRIVDAGDSDVIYADTKRSVVNAEQAVRALLDAGTMPYILGGDHAITMATVAAFSNEKPIHIVHLDAHFDFIDERNGITWGHGSPMRRAPEMPHVKGITTLGPHNMAAADFVEVSPPYDPSGITSLLAARTSLDFIGSIFHERARRRSRQASRTTAPSFQSVQHAI